MTQAIAMIGVISASVLLAPILFEFARVFFTNPIKAKVIIISIKDRCVKARGPDEKEIEVHNWPKIGKIPFTVGDKITVLYWPPFLFDRKTKFATFHPVAL